jgi:hypothetical protein
MSRQTLACFNMIKLTEYEMLFQDEPWFVKEIAEIKRELQRERYELMKIRTALLSIKI